MRRNGTVRVATLRDRFWDKVRKTDDCWLWEGARDPAGYGCVTINYKTRKAHRVAVRLDGRQIPPGMVIDHLCREPACVNPEHLDIVTHKQNTHRGNSPAMRVRRSGECQNGHPRTTENAIVFYDDRGRKHVHCRPCRREYTREYMREYRQQSA